MMESVSGDEFELSDEQESPAQDEKIFVAVRLRPLNEKEIAKNDGSDWECINRTTIIYKNNQSDRPMYPNAFTFDRVYGYDSSTKQIYDEGVKGIALSVLNGINSSIFAYGQTSSGKTYTMSGITEYAIADIYDYIGRQYDREFILKFSAMEIYNECVKDLLSPDSTQLRLLDDPEKGTVVEKLTEANLRDRSHLKELIYVSEAERQIGETALNEMSSRSHQILRLTVESSAREYKGADSGRTLSATVSFVDLAGSERASQTLAAGTRLKEGGHINRSLLTLGTVIRKLSKGGSGHVPYRNSKLTRILQNSLGGNARTAILCTVCPAHSHCEQSRNTLLFGSCAKDVSTNAQVNVVMSDKALVKQLQLELARLEQSLRMSPASDNHSASIIRDLELHIEKMEEKMEDLIQQRDLAQSRLEHLIQENGIDRNSLPWGEPGQVSEKGLGDTYEVVDSPRFGASYRLDENSPRNFLDQYSVPDPYQEITIDPEDSFIEDRNIVKTLRVYDEITIKSDNGSEEDHIDNDVTINQENKKDHTDNGVAINPENSSKEDQIDNDVITNPENRRIGKTSSIDNINDSNKEKKSTIEDDDVTTEEPQIDDGHEEKADDIEETLDDTGPNHVGPSPCSSDSEGMGLTRSKSCEEFTSTPSEKETITESSTNDNGSEKDLSGKQVIPKSKSEADVNTISRQNSLDEKEKDQNSPKPLRKLKDVFNDELNDTEEVKNDKDWCMVFEKQRRDIIKLWDECNIPLIHRTYFFLLFKGDQSDSVYMEVELRRLSFLKKTPSTDTSLRAISRERLMFSKKLLKVYSSTQRDAIFKKWGIQLESRHRRVQLSRLLWTKTNDMDHIKESAEIIAKLVGVVELNQTPKELFGLSFLPTPDHIKTSYWKLVT